MPIRWTFSTASHSHGASTGAQNPACSSISVKAHLVAGGVQLGQDAVQHLQLAAEAHLGRRLTRRQHPLRAGHMQPAAAQCVGQDSSRSNLGLAPNSAVQG